MKFSFLFYIIREREEKIDFDLVLLFENNLMSMHYMNPLV